MRGSLEGSRQFLHHYLVKTLQNIEAVLSSCEIETTLKRCSRAIGHWDPGLNLHRPQDERELRIRTGYRYEVLAEKIDVNAKGQFY